MAALEFRIRTADGKVEQLVVDADCALVGSGAHCEIRIAAEHAAPEHLEVELTAAGPFGRALALDPPPMLNGAPFTQGPLLDGSVVSFGPVELRVAAVDAASAGVRVVHRTKEKSNPLVYLLAAVAVPASLYVIFSDEADDLDTTVPTDAPALFAAAQAACPQADADQAAAIARDKLAIADAKRERRPFHVQDGVAAVPLFELAAACLAVAHDDDGARDARDAAAALRRSMEEDYRTHRVRLEHAVSIQDWPTAHREVRVLRALLENKQGAYVGWLSNLDRKLQLKYGHKG